ncbi:MAG: DinB family protein [Candidatus Hodarchaeota archaeon]
MKEQFIKLARLNMWANERFREVFKDLKLNDLQKETPYGVILDLIIHNFEALNVWLERMEKKPLVEKRKTSADYNSVSEVISAWNETDQLFLQVMKSFQDDEDFNRKIEYRRRGEETTYQVALGDVILHMSHHSFYHRGQLALLLRQYGYKPAPPTDANKYLRRVV